MKTITKEQWNESQRHEASFWQHQAKEGNKEQYHRWGWYRDVCFPSYLRRRFDGMKLMDVGSGPQGILHHVGNARLKVAVDPLADEFMTAYGDKCLENEVILCNAKAEDLSTVVQDHGRFDVVFCLNCLDHCQDPELVLREMNHCMCVDSELVLCVDMRRTEDLDELHKIQITSGYMTEALLRAGFRVDWWTVPHQWPTKTVQYCAIATKSWVVD